MAAASTSARSQSVYKYQRAARGRAYIADVRLVVVILTVGTTTDPAVRACCEPEIIPVAECLTLAASATVVI
ncbi:MAG: hypothetical protein OHK0015_12050 [Chloroflexi bacterium OHK40]